MSVEEAANAFEVSADTGEDWTVTLTGSNYAAAQAAKGEAETSLAGLNAQLTPLVAIAGLEQLGLDELNTALGIAEAAEAEKQADKSVPRRTTTPRTVKREPLSWPLLRIRIP